MQVERDFTPKNLRTSQDSSVLSFTETMLILNCYDASTTLEKDMNEVGNIADK